MIADETRRQELAREYEGVPSNRAFILICERLIASERAYYKTAADIDQTLGRALGYPRYCDDQLNFPGTTDIDGVCTGDHVPESLASEAAKIILALKNEIHEWEESDKAGRVFTDIIDELTAENAALKRERDEARVILTEASHCISSDSMIDRIGAFLDRTQPTPVSGEPSD